ncbi:hypothetical protein P3X46_008594 [Hevea brasiliensis]|uniref:RNase H type-1 domain-containing protein n=2 Tax=Hevea brasiliensis TaxID=3981 RepID=A0ABQ9MMM6_HEVBR|nr:hypothetical protein P3X46_008594 [Hevea brasiliensis]
MWHIWKRRNCWVFRKQHIEFQEVVNTTINHHDDYYTTQVINQNPQTSSSTVQSALIPPPMGVIKINFSAATNKHQQYGSIATFASDHHSLPCGWACRRIVGISNPLILESLACREALILAKAKGFSNVIIEGDSQVLIRAIQGSTTVVEIQGILHDIRHLSKMFPHVDFSFVRRECNQAAHSLVSKALRDPSFSCNPLAQLIFVSYALPP